MTTTALHKAVESLGGQCATARLLGTSQNAVRYWLFEKKGGSPPAEVAMQLERLTEGRIKKEELRPDLWRVNVSLSDTSPTCGNAAVTASDEVDMHEHSAMSAIDALAKATAVEALERVAAHATVEYVSSTMKGSSNG